MNDELAQRARTLRAKAESMLEHGATDEEAAGLYREAQVLTAAAKAGSLPRRSDWQELEAHRAKMKADGMAYPDDDGADTGDSGGPGGTLADDLLKAGWDLRKQPHATVPIDSVLRTRVKTGSLDPGSSIQDAVPREFQAPGLGADQRFVHTAFPRVPLEAEATGVFTYRQKSRTLASPSDMVRTIAATSEKPETSSVSEVVAAALKQVASVQRGTPNVLLASPSFRQWVNGDLLLAFNRALDFHVFSEVTTAVIGQGGGGANAFEDVLYTMEVVRAAGYAPNVVAVSPADALAIQLLQNAGGVSYVFNQTPPQLYISTAIQDGLGFVADAGAFGTLFAKPFSLQAFEEDSGQTNTSTVRGEADALFVVQRADAAASLGGGS
jgi:hypothetical protein